jgi:hypothetical protein
MGSTRVSSPDVGAAIADVELADHIDGKLLFLLKVVGANAARAVQNKDGVDGARDARLLWGRSELLVFFLFFFCPCSGRWHAPTHHLHKHNSTH